MLSTVLKKTLKNTFRTNVASISMLPRATAPDTLGWENSSLFLDNDKLAKFIETKQTPKAIVFEKHGDPKDVLKLVEIPSVGKLSQTEVKVQMLRAPINPADLNVVDGKYGILPDTLPAVGGNEGVGVVSEVGSAVSDLAVGDLVVPISKLFGTWQTELKADETQLCRVPASIPLEFLSTLFVSPATALRMLSDFATLSPGDWVIQNGANSLVGQAVITLSRYFGYNTINVVREGNRTPEQVNTLLSTLHTLGGNITLTDTMLSSPTFLKDVVGDLPPIKLALNCTGGAMGEGIAQALGDGGVMVTYGGMAKEPVPIPAEKLGGKNVSFKGFWMTDWYDQQGARAGRENMIPLFQDLLSNHPEYGWFTETVHFEDFHHVLAGQGQASSPFSSLRKTVLDFDQEGLFAFHNATVYEDDLSNSHPFKDENERVHVDPDEGKATSERIMGNLSDLSNW